MQKDGGDEKVGVESGSTGIRERVIVKEIGSNRWEVESVSYRIKRGRIRATPT